MGRVPPLLAGLIDDAAVFPPGNAPLPDAVAAHRRHRASWYADLVGPLLLPVSELGRGGRPELDDPANPIAVGLIGDTGIERLPKALATLPPGVRLRQVEVPVARRGEDPQPGLDRLLELAAGWPGVDTYAEVPLTRGLHAALDRLAAERSTGARVAAKFRTGGLAAELFPTPAELAAVICACRDRSLPFKLTAGLHQAARHTDRETGFTHHGFLNVLVAAAAAADGAEPAEVAQMLAVVDPEPLADAAAAARQQNRPLWIGFGSCSIVEPLADLVRLGLMDGGEPE
ncbi:MAG TPA: hypothetical protein VHN18_06455 [Micromonosporaceae bacterium]|nr:hypothetical protein [Micromonosporaceae bacterium]